MSYKLENNFHPGLFYSLWFYFHISRPYYFQNTTAPFSEQYTQYIQCLNLGFILVSWKLNAFRELTTINMVVYSTICNPFQTFQAHFQCLSTFLRFFISRIYMKEKIEVWRLRKLGCCRKTSKFIVERPLELMHTCLDTFFIGYFYFRIFVCIEIFFGYPF